MRAQSVTGAVRVGGNPYGIAVNAAANHIYVANSDSNNVTVIDASTNNTVYVSTGLAPRAVAVNPVTNQSYVANLNSGTVTVIDGATFATLTVSAGTSPIAVAVNPVTNQVYVANRDSNSVTVIDGATNAATTLSAGASPRAVAVNVVTNKIYVANYESNNVTVIDGASNTVTATVSTDKSPVAIAVNPVTNQVYTGNWTGNDVTVIDGATNNTATVTAGTNPRAIAVNPVTNKIYVANRNSGNVTVIDGATNNTTTVSAGTTPRSITVDSATNMIYVANRDSNTVTVINGATNSTLTLSSPGAPRAIAVNPVTNKIYVGNRNNNKVTVIDGSANGTATVSAGQNPSAVAVNPATGNIYVANSDDNTVTVIAGATGSTVSVPVGTTPGAVAVDPMTNQIYVADQQSDDVAVIDGPTNTTTFVPVGTTPVAIVVNPAANQIYVADQDSNDVTVIDGASNNTTTVNVGETPEALDINLVTNQIYVAGQDDNTVTVIDGATNSTTTLMAGIMPSAIAVNAVTNQIYVANQGSNTVTAIDGASTNTTTIDAGLGPVAIAVNPVTNQIYVANQTSDDVTVIDGATNYATAVSVGNTPAAIAVNPVINQIYVADQAGNDVAVIDGTSNRASFVNVGNSPAALAFNPATQQVYVANAVDNDVTVMTPAAVQAIPLTAQVQGVDDAQTVSGLAIFGTANPNPAFQASAASSYAPTTPAPTALYYQLDTLEGAWQAAAAAGPAGSNPANYSFSLSNVTQGVHMLYVYAAYGNEATTEDSVSGGSPPQAGSLTAYAFGILPEPSTPPTAYPAFSPAPGVYAAAQTVTLSDETSGAAIYYTLDGSTPASSSPLYSGPLTISKTTTVKAIAMASGYSPSGVANGSYTIGYPPANPPTFSPEPGVYSGTQTITLADTTPGAVMYYTTNGTFPATSSTKYTAPFQVTPAATILAVAFAPSYSESAIAKAVYSLTPADMPTFSPAPGEYPAAQTVTLSDTTPGAVIYYTTNGATPTTNSAQYSAPITVSVNPLTTILAMATATGYAQSTVAAGTYMLPQADPPTFSPPSGAYTTPQTVTISDDTPGAVIYYSLNGAWPATLYLGPVTVTPPATIWAYATATGYYQSNWAAASYYNPPTANPILTPSPGTYTSPQLVTMTDATPGAVIYYTTNGSAPTLNSSRYTAPVTVTPPTTVLAMAIATGYSQSGEIGGEYLYPMAATPKIWPKSGKYSTPQTVSLSDATAGAVLYYTTDGSTPTTSSSQYAQPFSVTPPVVIQAMAVAPGYYPSYVASATYRLPTQEEITFSPAPGTYTTAQSVTLSLAYPGATIYYTTDGSKPSVSSTQYTGTAITVSGTTRIRAVAIANGCCQVAAAGAEYRIVYRSAAPVFSPNPAILCGYSSVSLWVNNPHSTIYYTLDGTTPNEGSTLYTDPIAVGASTTITAIAYSRAGAPSEVITETYSDTCTFTLTPTPAAPVYGQAVSVKATINTSAYEGFLTVRVDNVVVKEMWMYGWSTPTALLAGLSAGQHTVGATFTVGNSSVQATPLQLTVAPTTLTVTVNNATRNYGSANPTFSGSIHGVVQGDGIWPTYYSNTPATAAIGTYTIGATLNDPNDKLGNYTVTLNDGTLTVNPLMLGFKANNVKRAYGAADPAFTGRITATAATLAAMTADGITVKYTSTDTISSPVGTSAITPQLNDPNQRLGNYVVTSDNGTLTITAAPVKAQAANQTRVYGTADPAFTGTVTATAATLAAMNSDGVSVAYTCSDTVSSPVAGYAIVPQLTGPAKALSNYAATLKNGTLRVTKAPVQVAAYNQTRVYGAADPVFTGTITATAATLAAMAADGITVTYTANDTVSSNVGQRAIIPILNDPNNRLANYSVTTKPYGTLTITPATLTVTANNASKVQGQPNPPLSGTVSGLIPYDQSLVTVTYSTTARLNSPPGTYPITPGLIDPGHRLRNYTEYITGGTLTVTSP
jgi:YVTN family beta-propeller protein